MFETPLRLASVLCSGLVLLGFVLFAVGEARTASSSTATAVAGRDAPQDAAAPAGPSPRDADQNRFTKAVDDANDVLLAPFAGLTADSRSAWAARGVPALLALLVYGFGLSFLARYATARA
jgi:hypothetical protein